MKKRLCKLMSCLLALVMIIGMLPVIASAADDEAKQVFEGGNYDPSAGLTVAVDNTQAVTHMTFDYTVESGEIGRAHV